MSKTDRELVAELNTNQEGAFGEIYRRYSSLLLRFVYRFTRCQQTAEELLHDIFSELLKGQFQNQSDGNLRSWLFTLAKNKSLNHLRSSQRVTLSDSMVEEAAEDQDLEDKVSKGQLLEKLLSSEKNLPTELRETWQLRRQGYDYQQIADKLAIPIGTVKSRFNRLVTLFREELNEPNR